MPPALQVSVLGPVEVARDGQAADLGTPKQRALVTALALTPGRPVSVDALADLLWGSRPPPGVTGTLQAYVSGLRRVLEPDRERREPPSLLVTVVPGYALRLPPEAVDAGRFERVVTEEHRRLATQGTLVGPPTLSADELTTAARRLDEVLALWRGEPFPELGDAAAAVTQRAHLEELRLVAREDRAVARLVLGDHGTTAADLATLTAAYPLRERLWALRALALFRSGRQAEALDVLRQVRALLADELGLDPGPEVQQLQDLVLRQDPALAWVTPRSAVTATSAPARTAEEAVAPPVPRGWPLAGRAAELVRLRDALAVAEAGEAAFAVLTGEPGIGKTRLAAELTAYAEERGARVLVGRCSQDEGAPPLWPWSTILRALGQGLPAAEDVGGDFGMWEAITRTLRDAAAAGRPGPLVLVLDDLHWADTATLRVLRLLVESAGSDPLLVLVTWRDQPRPTGALGDAAEALARRHATRVELTGLDRSEVAEVVAAVTQRRPSDEQATTLQQRTDGNPFFLVEYALLAGSGSGSSLERLLDEADPPTAVQEVINRRLDRLPATTVSALQAAAAVGRRFDVASLVVVTGLVEDDVLEALDPAQAAGLVREDGVDRFQFAHALVRDTLAGALTPSRRARQHARLAEHLAQSPDQETEVANHYLAAGPAYAGKAWRAATAAAGVAMRTYAYPEAVGLLRAALDALPGDPAATPRDRYDVLVALAGAYRRAAAWSELVTTVEQAVAVAEGLGDQGLGDPVLAAEAATMTAQGALWLPAAHGEVHEGVVKALRRSLAALPTGDSPLRCRCMVNLASELYYATGYEERRALADEALAMARRLDDRRLTLDVCLIAYLSIWAPGTAGERLDLASEAGSLADALGDGPLGVVAGTLQAVAAAELGRVETLWALYERTRSRAEALREAYSLLVLDGMVLAWRALAGRFDECDRLLGNVLTLVHQASLRHVDDAVRGNFLAIMQWRGDLDASDEVVADLESAPFPATSTIGMLLWRAGREDDARAYVREHPVDLTPVDWFSMLNWCYAGALAALLPDPELGARTYALLAPYAGRSCSAGTGVASGPVDAYLALAALAAGEKEVAARHADDAGRLAETWQVPLFARWWRDQRDRFGL